VTHTPAHSARVLDQAYQHFGITEPLPVRRNGMIDVEKAFARLQAEIVARDWLSEDPTQAEAMLQSFVRKDLPIEVQLRNSIAFVTFKGQDIIDSDPILKLMIGGDLTLWHFITQIHRIFPAANTMTISKMRWANDQASFQTATRLNNARVRGQATAISINRLFFIRKKDDLFHVAQATLVSGELIDSAETKSIHDDVRLILGSAETEVPVRH